MSAPLAALHFFSHSVARLPPSPDAPGGAAMGLSLVARTWLGLAATKQRLLAEMLVAQDACNFPPDVAVPVG